MISSIGEMGVSSLMSGGLLPPREVTRQHVDLEIDLRARFHLAESGHIPGVRDQINAEDVVLDLVDGQADAFDGDRALGGDQPVQRLRRADADAVRAAFAVHRQNLADAVNVAAHLVAEFGRALEIDAMALAPLVERGPGQGLVADFYGEPALSLLDHGQAAARVGDGGAHVDAGHVVRGLDLVAAVAVGVAHGADASHVGDNSGEHQAFSYRSHRSSPTVSTATRRKRGAAARSFSTKPPTPGRPSSPSTIGARNHSTASTSPAARKLAATCPPPSIITFGSYTAWPAVAGTIR